jgi:hypothetical protein
VTLGVTDLKLSREFYERFGWKSAMRGEEGAYSSKLGEWHWPCIR